eukprot:13866508-Alexandrium_andersonii.AAC.1
MSSNLPWPTTEFRERMYQGPRLPGQNQEQPTVTGQTGQARESEPEPRPSVRIVAQQQVSEQNTCAVAHA